VNSERPRKKKGQNPRVLSKKTRLEKTAAPADAPPQNYGVPGASGAVAAGAPSASITLAASAAACASGDFTTLWFLNGRYNGSPISV
jgi:hypothetical protein